MSKDNLKYLLQPRRTPKFWDPRQLINKSISSSMYDFFNSEFLCRFFSAFLIKDLNTVLGENNVIYAFAFYVHDCH